MSRWSLARSSRATVMYVPGRDRGRLAVELEHRDRGAQIAFCPSSNLFLGSGLFGWAAAEDAGVHISLASDVGGGTSLSLPRNMGDAYKVQAMAQAGWLVARSALARQESRGSHYRTDFRETRADYALDTVAPALDTMPRGATWL